MTQFQIQWNSNHLLFSVLIYQFGNFPLSFQQTFHPSIHVSIRWNLYRIFSIHSKEIFI
jgi:hypothetical protein